MLPNHDFFNNINPSCPATGGVVAGAGAGAGADNRM